MKVSVRADGFRVEGSVVLEAADAVLRGLGQVMFQNNSYTGVLFLAGAFASSWAAGVGLVAGCVVSTLVAYALGADRGQVRAGLFGFNGALVGIALVAFCQINTALWAYLVLGAGGSTIVTAALMRGLEPSRLPALTAPFVLVTWAQLAARGELLAIHANASIADDVAAIGMTLATVTEGAVRGISQVFLQTSVVAGSLFLLGLLVASRRACVVALTGSLLGLLTAWAFGAPELSLRTGLFGYNAALTAVALLTFLAPGRRSVMYTAAAVAISAVMSAALAAALAPLAVPALTAPFVLVVWCALLAAPALTAIDHS